MQLVEDITKKNVMITDMDFVCMVHLVCTDICLSLKLKEIHKMEGFHNGI